MGGNAEPLPLKPGDNCETLSLTPLRREEAVYSEFVTDLPVGIQFKVLEIGSGTPNRVKINAGATVGWITARTKSGHIVKKLTQKKDNQEGGFVTGQQQEAKSLLVVRETENADSPLVTELDPGTVLRILEFSKTDANRARIATERCDGWVSLVTKRGQPLIGKLSDPLNQGVKQILSPEQLVAGPIASKTLLESARAGDTKRLRLLIEDETLAAGLDLNSCDIRGRTALMYAAAFGNKGAVEYLLSMSEVQVSATDDTSKTALHHAAKRPPDGSKADTVQAEVLQLLLSRGAQVEARDHNGCTALMFAVSSGDVGASKVLIQARANVNGNDYEGNTPLVYAHSFQHTELVQMLKKEGAEPEKPAKTASPKRRRTSLRTKAFSKAGIVNRTHSNANAMQGEVVYFENTGSANRAKAKLAQLLSGEADATELERAIKDARDAKVDDEKLLADSQAKLAARKAREKAQRELYLAMEEPSVDGLKLAIANALKEKVLESDIKSAQSVLAEEEAKEVARQKLKEAQEQGDAELLRAAIKEAQRVQATEDLKQYEDLLNAVESKDKAAKALEEAISSKSVTSLQFHLKTAKEAGVEAALLKTAEEFLAVEMPKAQARQGLVDAMKVPSLEGLRKALQEAEDKGLSAEPSEKEFNEASEMLRQEEEKKKALDKVHAAIEEAKSVFSSDDIEVLRAAKSKLNEVFMEAKAAGVAEEDLREVEQRRRRLHNAIEDLKGSIRVFCRVRPLSKKEVSQGDGNVLIKIDSMTVCASEKPNGHGWHYSFDSVFMPGTQEEVFEDCKDLVQSAIDGYNVTMFAYGQTGAGKTFTMYGGKDCKGIVPRIIDEIYRLMDANKARFTFTLMASMMELYRNDLVDLLHKKGSAGGRKSVAQGMHMPMKINVRIDAKGDVMIENLMEEECKDAAALSDLLERGNKQRSVAATAMNSESSRSHSLLMIKLVSVNLETREQTRGKILLCDLAGSERLKKSEVTGDMQKEAIEINKSLTALGNVIEALTSGKKQIPYRDHKLTQVMQDALGGTSKTLMFVNCSPASSNYDETVMSLKYATRAKKITNDTRKAAK